ncbi:Tpr-related protein family member, putative [Theileria annulata]|uniref:Tpr-related protein family member, putative n=1 Tax=Theileria annulata TaxID=5874 RepID=Q4UC20_THEAN|nr:Tpr-related protein family member, putative [Theileria annulata]CAI75631.1 Tpr-related protein family member, putative [Theileria annulata]|eukprot:XP_955107.1 Tpr-related protein family member, putative [Theileria annulata]
MTTSAADPNPTKNYKPDDDDKALQIVAYMFAGLAMMLNIRLSYSAAPFALLRFKLPENLFSVFVRRIASALELWCLPSIAVGNIVDMAMKLCTTEKATYDNSFPAKLKDNTDEEKLIHTKWIKFNCIIVPSILNMCSGGSSSSGRLTASTKYNSLKDSDDNGRHARQLWHILPSDQYDPNDKPHPEIVSPALMVIVGMGLVYAIYPGIAPGMIVPFYLIDKIEMVLLIATIFPPVIVSTLIRVPATQPYSPKSANQYETPGRTTKPFGGWRHYHLTDAAQDTTRADTYNTFWHFIDVMIILKISLAAIFIYSLHYRVTKLNVVVNWDYLVFFSMFLL